MSIYTNPSLSKVYKFSNVALLLDYNAAEATVGRNILSAKFDGAIITLKKWFGQEQMIFDYTPSSTLECHGSFLKSRH